MLNRLFRPNPESNQCPFQQETYADGDFGREAVRACKILNNRREYNSPSHDGLRAAYKGREAEYLYARFAAVLGWKTLGDAEKFYKRNR